MLRIIFLLLTVILPVSVLGCNIDLSEQGQKDRALADKVTIKLETRPQVYGDYIRTLTYDRSKKGNYNFNFLKTDMEAQEVFDMTLRLLIVVQQQNDGVVMTGRSFISVTGHMGSEKVVYGSYTSGPTLTPFNITLEGRYADAEFNEEYNIRRRRGGGFEE